MRRVRYSFTLPTVLALVAATSCSADERAEGRAGAVSCNVARVTECAPPAPRFADVEPIFHGVCGTASCHGSAPAGPWPLDTYQHIADWQDVIQGDLLTCAMPPPDAPLALSDRDRELILRWIRCGYPE